MSMRTLTFGSLRWREEAPAVLWSLVFVAFTGVVVAGIERVVELDSVTSLFLIPVLIAATRWGAFAAAVAALAGVALVSVLFYPPLYNFRVSDMQNAIDVALFLVVATVTGRLATNLRRAKLRAEAEALREALIDSVSHELRTPLASILGAASVMGKSPELARDPRLSGLTRVVREEAQRLDQHVQNLLDATRIGSESVQPHLDLVDPADIVNAALAPKRALLANHRVSFRVADDLPLVRTDAALLGRAFGQFIENAAKYSPAGSVVEITATREGRDVRLAVTDAGVGLTPDEKGAIWARFYRGARHARTSPGSGLGLWIARSLVAACGGSVEAESRGEGLGATFSIRLPASVVAPPAEEGHEDHDE